MNDEWKRFLESRSATIDSAGAVHFPGPASAPDCALFDLSHLGLIQVSGNDAESFLQGQLTNDVREVSSSHHQLSGYCTPKGRLLAGFLVFRHAGTLFLQLPRDRLQPTIGRLSMFVLMSRVTVEDASDRLVRIGLAGDCAPELLATAFTKLPQRMGDATEEDGVSVLRLGGRLPRYEMVGGLDVISLLWDKLAPKATPADRDYWSLLEIRAGIPSIDNGTVEAFVPQMLNFQALDGVSFTKGCYTGQEVVARMKYLGKLKRRMYLAHADADSSPRPGDEVFSVHSESGQGAGKVVDARPAPEGGYDLLVVLEISSREQDDLHLTDASGPRLNFLELPYTVEQEETSQ